MTATFCVKCLQDFAYHSHLLFILLKKEKGIGFVTCVFRVILCVCVCDKLFPCRFVPLLYPNPSDASTSLRL